MTPADYQAVLDALDPGRSYYVPIRPRRPHPVWSLLDERVHHVLCAEMGGTFLYVPIGDGAIQKRRSIALRMKIDGASSTDIATGLGISVRTAERYLRAE